MSIATYASHVRALARKLETSFVFVASDEARGISAMMAALGPGFNVLAQSRGAEHAYAIRNRGNGGRAPLSDVRASEVTFLVDVGILVRSTAFVGTASSNVGRFIFFMRDAAAISISLDDGGNFLRRHC